MFRIILLVLSLVIPYIFSRQRSFSGLEFFDPEYRPSDENANRNSQAESQWRIRGGKDCELLWFLISFRNRRTFKHFCGGTAIAPRWLLTAASCFDRISDKPNLVIVLIGVTHLTSASVKTTREVDKFLLHREYDPITRVNDIALAHLTKTFPLLYPNDLSLCYAQLPKEQLQDDLSRYCNPSAFMATGWGAVTQYGPLGNKPLHLKCANLTYITTNECLKYSTQASDKTICTLSPGGGKDAGPGDTGGPLLCRRFQLGIVSWVLECSHPNPTRFHTRVDKYLDFIHLTMTDYRDCGNQHTQLFSHLSIFLSTSFLTSMLK